MFQSDQYLEIEYGGIEIVLYHTISHMLTVANLGNKKSDCHVNIVIIIINDYYHTTPVTFRKTNQHTCKMYGCKSLHSTFSNMQFLQLQELIIPKINVNIVRIKNRVSSMMKLSNCSRDSAHIGTGC